MKLNLRKKSKGFTLVEILLVVGFIALASIGIYAVYNKVTTTAKANQENRNMQTIRAGIKQLFGNQQNYTGLTETVVRNARISPQDMHTGAATLTNAFGGAVTIAPQALGAAPGFRITTASIPGDVCVKLASGAGSSFDQVTIGGTVVKAIGTNTQVNPVTVTTQCNADTVTMIFDSY
jgi:type II secretory pathway pseudopilin PulG